MATFADQAIDAIYEASVEAERWPDALRRVGDVLNAATGAIYSESHGETFSLLSRGVLYGHSDAAIAAYADYFCARNPFNVAIHLFDQAGVLTDSDFDARYGRRVAFDGSEYLHDWVQPQRLRHVIGQRIRTEGDAVVCAAFWRQPDAGPFGADDVATLRRIGGHINRALDVGTRLRTAEAEMEAMLGRGAAAVFTLARDGALRRCNAAAEALLRSGNGLRVEGGRLRTALLQDQPALERLIACVFDQQRVFWAENARLPIHRADGHPPLVARIAATAARFDPFAPDRAAAAVLTVEGFEAQAAVQEERLRLRFGLSPAQARLALRLRSGRGLKEAAAELGIAYETARTQLKAVFERTGTDRQAALVLLLQREVGT